MSTTELFKKYFGDKSSGVDLRHPGMEAFFTELNEECLREKEKKQLKLPKKYNSFTSDYIDSNWYQMLIEEEIDEETSLRSFAAEWQFQVDGFSNNKIVDNLIERYNSIK